MLDLAGLRRSLLLKPFEEMRMTFRWRWIIWQIQKLMLPYRSACSFPQNNCGFDFSYMSISTNFLTCRLILNPGKGKDSEKHQKLQLNSLYKWALKCQEVTYLRATYCSTFYSSVFMFIFFRSLIVPLF